MTRFEIETFNRQGSTPDLESYFLKAIVTSLLTILLCPPVAFFACYGRGCLLPVSFIIITLLIANFTGLLGWGPYFPWAIPGLFGVAPGTEGM